MRFGVRGRVRTGMRAAGAAIVIWAVLAAPKLAAACSVCTAGRDEENQAAFLIATLFMSLLPLVAIGSIVYFIYRRIQKMEAAEEAKATTRKAVAAASAVGPHSA